MVLVFRGLKRGSGSTAWPCVPPPPRQQLLATIHATSCYAPHHVSWSSIDVTTGTPCKFIGGSSGRLGVRAPWQHVGISFNRLSQLADTEVRLQKAIFVSVILAWSSSTCVLSRARRSLVASFAQQRVQRLASVKSRFWRPQNRKIFSPPAAGGLRPPDPPKPLFAGSPPTPDSGSTAQRAARCRDTYLALRST